MNIFFDVDATIVGACDGKLRPLVREVFGGVAVEPFYYDDPRDREMERVYRAVLAHAEAARG